MLTINYQNFSFYFKNDDQLLFEPNIIHEISFLNFHRNLDSVRVSIGSDRNTTEDQLQDDNWQWNGYDNQESAQLYCLDIHNSRCDHCIGICVR